MSVIVFLDHADGHVRKASLEAACYGAKVAEQIGTVAEGVILGSFAGDIAGLGKYGLKKVHTVSNTSLDQFDSEA